MIKTPTDKIVVFEWSLELSVSVLEKLLPKFMNKVVINKVMMVIVKRFVMYCSKLY